MTNFMTPRKCVYYALLCSIGIGITGCNYKTNHLGMRKHAFMVMHHITEKTTKDRIKHPPLIPISQQPITPIEQYLTLLPHEVARANLARLIYQKLPGAKNANSMKILIESNRFIAESLYAPNPEKNFDTYNEEIKTLYEETLGNTHVMEKYGLGRSYTPEEFMDLLNEHARRWEKGYPFAGFMVRDKKTNAVVGYEVIAELNLIINKSNESVNKPNTCSIAICYSPAYHRSDTIQNVGSECCGSLCLVYGQYLFEKKAYINKVYNEATEQYEKGEPFQKLEFTVRTDNFSSKMPKEKFGFCKIDEVHKYGCKRFLFEKIYQDRESKITPIDRREN